MNATMIGECLREVQEVHFETESAGPKGIVLLFGRMTPLLKDRLMRLREFFSRHRVLLYFRPLGEGRMGLSLIVRESLLIVNTDALPYDLVRYRSFSATLLREQQLPVFCCQRDRQGQMRFISDDQLEPLVLPAQYFRSAGFVLEE